MSVSRSGFVVALVLAFFTNALMAQEYDFFWSVSDLNSGATNSDAVANLEVGETGSLFLYYTTNGPIDSNLDTGAWLDIETAMSGVIAFTDAETFDFDITVVGFPFDGRWTNLNGKGGVAGHTGTVSDNLIDELFAFGIYGQGILENNNGSGPFLDEGYDAGADAFLFGRRQNGDRPNRS